MNPNKLLSPSKPSHVGCVEANPSESALFLFVGHGQTYGFPKRDFQQLNFILTELRRQQPPRPPQELRLFCPGRTITLNGWRLESLPESLAAGKIHCIHAADGVLANLVIEEPLVCRIRITWPTSPEGSTESMTLHPPKAC